MKTFTTCDICGASVKARGIGSHKRLAHGIVERIILKPSDISAQVADISTQVAEVSTQVADLCSQVADCSDEINQINDSHNISDLSPLSATCDICGVTVEASSIESHKQLVHGTIDSNIKMRRPSDFIPKGFVGEKQMFQTSDELIPLKETVKAQSSIIRNQTMVINAINPEQNIVEKLSNETGKDLTECKRQDGEHLYTDQDIFILLAKLTYVNWGLQVEPFVADFLQWSNAERVTRKLIADFEHRFQCKFDDVKQASSDLRKDYNEEDYSLATRYMNLPYSR